MKMAAGQRKEILLKIGTVFSSWTLLVQKNEKENPSILHQFYIGFCMTNFIGLIICTQIDILPFNSLS